MSKVFIDDYRAVHLAAQHMLTSARRGAWKEVSTIAAEIAKSTQALATAGSADTLGVEDRNERTQILKSLVSIDYEISSLRDPQAQQLDLLLRG